MSKNLATDFSVQPNAISYGSDISVPITFFPHLETNRNTMYWGLCSPTVSQPPTIVSYLKKITGSFTRNLTIPASYFKQNNSFLYLEVNTCDSADKFVSGSFAHTILLYHPNYKNYLSNFTHPRRTYPGETCTIEILPPKDTLSGGFVYTVDLMYHQSVGRDIVGTNLPAGKFSFVVPELAINSSMTIRVTTISKATGAVQGTISQSLKIEQASSSYSSTTKLVQKPSIILPQNYTLTLSEGENIQIKGTSESLNDYKIIYAKRPCDVANAVSKYTSPNTYFDASPTDLKKELIENSLGDAEYYVLKDFDQESTFITQDLYDKKTFHIRTPSVNEAEFFDDFYALQWFKNIEPGDLVYVYAIQRGTEYITTINTTPNLAEAAIVDAEAWRCKHCNLNNYSWWSRSSNWNPYCKVDLNTIKTFINCRNGYEFTAYFTVRLGTNVKHPPIVWVTTSSNKSASQCSSTTLTVVEYQGFQTGVFRYAYHVPISFIKNALNNGIRYIYFHTHWGENKENSVQYTELGRLTVASLRRGISTSDVTTKIGYSDNRYNNIKSIPLSEMTPYVVIPPAIRPLELILKEKSSKQVTISYANPLYNAKAESVPTYNSIGNILFDVSQGDDINDLSNLNSIEDENGNTIQVDKTLDVNAGEKRLLTYEKTLPIPTSLINSIKNSTSKNLCVDLNLKSIDGGNLNFKPITTDGTKVQVMFSKSGENLTRMLNYTGDIIDYKKSEYNIQKDRINKEMFVSNDFDTIHLLYNTDKYESSKSFDVLNKEMAISSDKVLDKVGWRKINPSKNEFGRCCFYSETFEIAKYALNYDKYKIRLCLENMEADKALFAAPKVTVSHRNVAGFEEEAITETKLIPIEQGIISPGSDLHYDIPYELYNVNIDDFLLFSLAPETPYPIDMPEITFSNAYIEVIGLHDIEQIINKYTEGFYANITVFEEKTSGINGNAGVSLFDPVECVDVIMCCFDSNKQLINKTRDKVRDIYNGQELIYYTDRRWHSFVNDKYINHIKYKSNYDMTFVLPENTEYYFFIAFTYSNWHNNPSIYSMSNILTMNSVKQDFSLQFVEPKPIMDDVSNTSYANSDINNPVVTVKINAQKNSSITISGTTSNSYNLAKDKFDIDKWRNNPIIYSNTKTYGYELPIFNAAQSYMTNNVVNNTEPLYNDIEYYYHWKNLYGKERVRITNQERNKDEPIKLDSKYTVYEDEGDKFISNKSIPYIEIPAEIYSYDKSKISLFLDATFNKAEIPEPEIVTKLVTETFTINYKLEKVRNNFWGVKTLWNKGLMDKLGDISTIEDLKIEWGMKLNLDHRHPTEGRRGPILLEDFWDAVSHYKYNPITVFSFLKDKTIRDYGGHDIWHKNYGDYIYFEITNPRLKRLFLDSNCHYRRHDAILFEDFKYDWCWETTIKVRFTVTKKVKEDGSPIYDKYLPEENFTSNYNVPGWSIFKKPIFKATNIRLTKSPTPSDPSFVLKYDVMISPMIYKHDNATGDSLGNKFKYSWGRNEDHYRKWETVTITGKAPFIHEKTEYFIYYDQTYNVITVFRIKIDTDGTATLL